MILLGFSASSTTLAYNPITNERIQIVQKYLQNLQDKNVQGMRQIFESNGTVISTSKGMVNADEFFNSFLPELTFSAVTVSQVYLSLNDKDHLGAKFHFSFKLKNGEQGGGDYVDDFTFTPESKKIKNVHMFENVKS